MRQTALVLGLILTVGITVGSAQTGTTIADSVNEFSGTQGQNNWYYGYYDKTSDANGVYDPIDDFQQMPKFGNIYTYFGDWIWYVSWGSGGYWTSLGESGGHPNGTNGNGGRLTYVHWPIRRWVSEVEGTITISGTFGSIGGGNITGYIIIDGVQVWSQNTSGGPGVYTVEATVQDGSTVDFAITPGQNDSDVNDSTEFTAVITVTNNPPVADAGGPYEEPATSWDGASVSLDGGLSYDPDGDNIVYAWDLDLLDDSDGDGDPTNDVNATGVAPTEVFPVGHTDISLTVTDPFGASATDTSTVTVEIIDSDGDGLFDIEENVLGTDPLDADSDDDGLLDGTEVDMAEGTGCPDPLNPDSDGDTLLDGAEVDIGTCPCNPDSDGDRVEDNEDPTPNDPGVTSGWLEDEHRKLSAEVLALDLSLFDAPNNNAAEGRRNAMSNRLSAAANAIAGDDYQGAIDQLTSLLAKIDGAPQPKDWMGPSPERDDLKIDIEFMIYLLTMLL